MTNRSNHPLVSTFRAQAELEFMQLILEQPSDLEDLSYPYNPADPAADAYFDALEQEVLALGWSEADLMAEGKILSRHIDQLWVDLATSEMSTAASITEELSKRFSARVPQQILDGIVQKARQVFNQNLSLSDQLVQCVQGYLPVWGVEDLQVFARPLAYAMRAPEAESLDSTLQTIRPADWQELSDVEQARLSLAIARYAIAQVATEADQNSQD